MKYPIYSIRDKHTGFMPQLMLEQNDNSARRGFAYAVNNPDGVMNFAPGDYDLYKVGTFDSESGVISSVKVPNLVCSGSSVVGD